MNGAMAHSNSSAEVEIHEDHGSTPAAWTLVVIITLGFIVGTLGIVIGNWTVFWIGAALVPLGAIVGGIMKKAGLGKKPA